MRNHPFFGWQVQKEINKELTLGGEWFNPGRQSFATANTHILNFGGLYNFNKNFSLLFTAGHSVQGESHTVAYLGLYWTWGKKGNEDAKETKAPGAMSSLLRNTGSARLPHP
jgi:hypothetical protein